VDAEKRLYDDLKWAGLSWDEGMELLPMIPDEGVVLLMGLPGPDVGGKFGPYRQVYHIGLPLYICSALTIKHSPNGWGSIMLT